MRYLGPIVIKYLTLKKGKESALRQKHPWIFSGAFADIPNGIANGEFVGVRDSEGTVLCHGHFQNESIAVKVIAYNQSDDEGGLIRAHLREAITLRRTLGLFDNAHTTACRLVNAEGDGLPGLIIDKYNETAVFQFHSEGMRRLAVILAEELIAQLDGMVTSAYDKPPQDKGGEGGYILGAGGRDEISENGLLFKVDWEHGQKTGFFLDQRENRQILRSLSTGKNVLNAFSYTGGFSVYALAGNASQVTSLDSSQGALRLLRENVALNFGEGNAPQAELCVDCLKYLKEMTDIYDIIVLDPPAFIKHRGAYAGGIQGYKSINTNALKHLASGGLLFTFSCSQLLSRGDLLDVLRAAAVEAGRRSAVVRELHHSPCHPVSIFHPEGDYLKGFVLEVR